MLVRFVWPNCRFTNLEWRMKGVDSFWVECSIEEIVNVAQHVTASDKCFERMLKFGEDIKRPRCYLVSRHLESVVAMKWSYPISNQWNGYGPFRELTKHIIISRLEELSKARIPKNLRD